MSKACGVCVKCLRGEWCELVCRTRRVAFAFFFLVGCTDVNVHGSELLRDADENTSIDGNNDGGSPDNTGSEGDASVSPSGDAGEMSPIDDPPPANTTRCTLGVDCDKIAFDCSGCDDNNTCTTDICDVNKAELTKTCSHAPVTNAVCDGGAPSFDRIQTACAATNGKVTFNFSNGECHSLENPYSVEHKSEIVAGFCCTKNWICGKLQATADCTKVL